MASVLVTDEQGDQPVDTQRWMSLAAAVLEAEGVGGTGELSVAFVGEEAMADLNQRFAGEGGPTDVLAFPIDDAHGDADAGDGTPLMLGDVVICPAVADRNAPGHGASFEDELALLVVHGTLHVLGMDHGDPATAATMQARERELLSRFHVPASS